MATARSKSNDLVNKLLDFMFRGVSYTPPSTIYFALLRATAGVSPRSTAVTVGQTTVPASHNGRMYKCTTAGTTGASEPTWGTTDNGTTTDGTAAWTEMYSDFKGYTSAVTSVEASGTNYARIGITASATNFAATNAAGSTTNPSTGTSGQTSNNIAVTYGAPGSNWGVIAGVYLMSAVTSGNPLRWSILDVPKTVNNGDPAPTFPISSSVWGEE